MVAAFCTTLASAQALVISYHYDSAGRLTTANYGGVSSTSYGYDANGNLLSRTNSQSIFVPLAGNYAGLIAASPVLNAGAGSITLSVSLTGSFSGRLVLGGKTFKLRDEFDANGDCEIDLPTTPAVHLSLHIDPVTREVTGTVSGGVVAALTAFPAPFGKKAPAPGGAVGKFTALFSATENMTTVPKGTGFGMVTVAATGSVKMAGTLADGTKFSQGTTLVSETRWPLYASLYKNAGHVAGLVEYAPLPGTGDFANDPLEKLDWVRPGGGLYAAAFTTELDFSAARYAAPAKNQRVLDLPDTSPNGDFLAPGIDRLFTLDAKNRIVVETTNPENLVLKLNVKTGTVSGSLTFGGKVRKLAGILQLEPNVGAGFFFSDSESLPFVFGED